jgi:hypothetical protein
MPVDRRRTQKLELETRNSLIRLSRLIVALRDEMSLLPVRVNHHRNANIQALTRNYDLQKPMKQYRNAISSMQAILDILTGLRTIRDRIPVREAISGVVNDRREFVRRHPSIHRSHRSVSDARGKMRFIRYLVYASRCMPVNTLSGRASHCRSFSRPHDTRTRRSCPASRSPCAIRSGYSGCHMCMFPRKGRYWRTSSIRSKAYLVPVEHYSVPPSGSRENVSRPNRGWHVMGNPRLTLSGTAQSDRVYWDRRKGDVCFSSGAITARAYPLRELARHCDVLEDHLDMPLSLPALF